MADDQDKPGELHDIFSVDPLDLERFVGSYVQTNLLNGINLLGIIYTIDPVSQSCILICRENTVVSMKIVLKHSISSISIIPEVPLDYEEVNINSLFYNNERSDSETEMEKERVKLWLCKNMIPVEEKNGVLKLDSLEIHPPYDINSCFCSNSIILDRVQSLLKTIKNDGS